MCWSILLRRLPSYVHSVTLLKETRILQQMHFPENLTNLSEQFSSRALPSNCFYLDRLTKWFLLIKVHAYVNVFMATLIFHSSQVNNTQNIPQNFKFIVFLWQLLIDLKRVYLNGYCIQTSLKVQRSKRQKPFQSTK